MFEFKFPDVGEGITEGNLVKWLVKVGQTVKKESPVAEVETDKAVVEIPSPVDGVVTKLMYKEHETMYVGKTMIVFDGDISSDASSSVSKKIKTPAISPVVSPAAQKVEIKTATTIAQSQPQLYSQQQSIQQSPQSSPLGILATPRVRQVARELGVDISRVVGTGELGKITEADVRNSVGGFAPVKQATQPSQTSQTNYQATSRTVVDNVYKAPAGVLSETGSGPIETIKANAVRKIISRRMTESKNTAVHFTISDEADVTQIVEMREKNKVALEARGIKLTYLAFFVKAAVLALEKNPKLNSVYNEAAEEIIYKKFYNMGIAVDTPVGLVVPVIKNCESKTIVDIAVKIADLATRARDKKLSNDEMTGGTFTITSVGSIAGQFFTQIINQPESAILGIGKIVEKPVVKNGAIVIRKMLTLGVTADHRTIDGADAARFLQSLISYLENPDSMLLELM